MGAPTVPGRDGGRRIAAVLRAGRQARIRRRCWLRPHVPIAFALTIVSIAITNWMLQHVPVQWLFMPVAIRQAIVLIASGECSGRRTAERKCRAERAPCAQAHIIARSNGRSSFFSSVSCDGGCASFSGFSG